MDSSSLYLAFVDSDQKERERVRETIKSVRIRYSTIQIGKDSLGLALSLSLLNFERATEMRRKWKKMEKRKEERERV